MRERILFNQKSWKYVTIGEMQVDLSIEQIMLQ